MQYLSNFLHERDDMKTFAVARETRMKLHSRNYSREKRAFKSVGEKIASKFGRHRTENGGNKTVRLTFQSCALAVAHLIKIFLSFMKLIFHSQKKSTRHCGICLPVCAPNLSSFFSSFLFFWFVLPDLFLRKFNA